ncbi:MAG: RNA polymerase sigma factor [Steroidobacteraceae bacterium]|nr:RNA polymerase sigma factor [Steroidobacteraceae bacterium]MDW8259185.1 RNA polymerase sigma factor [Gammaproteobacteria bacterium]
MNDAPGDDSALFIAYAQGDLQAFERLYRRHRSALYRYLVRQCRDRELANDLFQAVWEKVIAQRQRYEPRAKFQTYLYTVAYNCFVDHCRRSAARPHPTVTADAELDVPARPADAPERQAEASELRRRIDAAVAALPAEQRDAFLLYEESGLSVEQIGAIMGVGAETAKSRLRYAVAKLRVSLAEIEQLT